MNKTEILDIIERVHSLKKGPENSLPSNSHFLDETTVLCYPTESNDSRYPYHNDGMVLFAHSTGFIDCVEGRFNIFKPSFYNEDASVAFFGGEKYKDGYFPYSVTGAAKQLFEENTLRYTVFSPACTYYVTETPKAIFAARVYVTQEKHIRFSLCAINLAEEREIYLCSFMEPNLRYESYENDFARMTKYGEHFENGGYLIKTRNATDSFDALGVNVTTQGDVANRHYTVSKNGFIGGRGGNLTNAVSLKEGKCFKTTNRVNTTEIPVVSDIVHFNFPADGYCSVEYDMIITQDEEKAKAFINSTPDLALQDEALKYWAQKEKQTFKQLDIKFENWHDGSLHSDSVNNFLKCVQRQIDICALGKNYAGPHLGVRDVFQQLESALLWQPAKAREQIVKVLDLILEDGRPPRQVSFPTPLNPVPDMDLRPFIDQGFWIIATLHTYLSYTEDYSILDEVCGYFKAEETYGPLSRSETHDSVLCHLIKITNFLISNIDEKTNCIRALFGDWNDALDGLGKTADTSKEFGSGVSVMATLQLYLALQQMEEIIGHTSADKKLLESYSSLKTQVADGIYQNAVVRNAEGKARMLHGWGDNRSYFVGGYKDFDGNSRISLASHSYTGISGILENFPEIKEDIATNILSLDSKYGFLTFDTPFYQYAPEVGRVSTITIGTYENSCAYVHAGTFGALALFFMGYGKAAWKSLIKAMTISHKEVTKTTFVMPNSYCRDDYYDFDGESMGDWYTGSGTVLIKDIIKGAFGIEPDMDGLKIAPTSYFPSEKAEITLYIKGSRVTVKYENQRRGVRNITLNGETLPLELDSLRNVDFAYISKNDLPDVATIVIVD